MTNDQTRMTNEIRNPNDEWRHLFVILVWSFVISAIAGSALAQDNAWTMTTADFRAERVSLRSLADNEAAVEAVGNPQSNRRIGYDRLLMLERVDSSGASSMPAADKHVLVLYGNDRISGVPQGIEQDRLIWENPSLGRLSLPMRSVMGIVRAGNELSLPGNAAGAEDVVTLNNGDNVRGIVAAINAGAVALQQPALAENVFIPFASITRVSFAATGTPPAPIRGFRVGLADGSAITAPRIRLPDQQAMLSIELAGEPTPRTVALTTVVSIEQVNGPVVWLSSLTPTEAVGKPFLDRTWPLRVDRTVDGSAIQFGDRVYVRGIGVHSYSAITYAIDPAWKTFRTQYAIAGDLPYADVTVRIKLDGQVVHERAEFRTGMLVDPVVINVSGKKQITLEVDYGKNYDVQDRFNWIEPAFLNFVPQ